MPLAPELAEIIADHTDLCPGASAAYSVGDGEPEALERYRYIGLALAGEAGEHANKIKKDWRDGTLTNMDAAIDELVDVANYVYMQAHHLGIDLEALMLDKMRKVAERPEIKKLIRHRALERRLNEC